MDIKSKVEALAKVSADNGDAEFISGQLDSICSYHNTVVRMEQNMQFQKHRLEPVDFQEWLSDQNDSRIKRHERMIDAVIIVNRYCKNNEIEPLYDGKIDETLRYKDADTRFGIAEFAGKYCSEMFQAGQNDSINKKHEKVISDVLAKGEAMAAPISDMQYQ